MVIFWWGRWRGRLCSVLRDAVRVGWAGGLGWSCLCLFQDCPGSILRDLWRRRSDQWRSSSSGIGSVSPPKRSTPSPSRSCISPNAQILFPWTSSLHISYPPQNAYCTSGEATKTVLQLWGSWILHRRAIDWGTNDGGYWPRGVILRGLTFYGFFGWIWSSFGGSLRTLGPLVARLGRWRVRLCQPLPSRHHLRTRIASLSLLVR